VIARRKELFLVIRILQIPTTPSTLALTLFATVYDPMRAYACEHMHASMILFCQNNNFFVHVHVHWKLVIEIKMQHPVYLVPVPGTIPVATGILLCCLLLEDYYNTV